MNIWIDENTNIPKEQRNGRFETPFKTFDEAENVITYFEKSIIIPMDMTPVEQGEI